MHPITLSSARTHQAVSGAQIAKSTTAPQRIDSLSLLSGNRELIIEHGGFEYRLRRTQNDKLILTK
jgi:hemin uptake protein HemP